MGSATPAGRSWCRACCAGRRTAAPRRPINLLGDGVRDALDPRLRFLQRLAAEEAMLPRAGAERQGGEAGDRIAEVYGLLSKTFVLPSVRPAAGAPVERGGQSSSGASGAGAAAAGAAAGAYGYDEAKERAKREAFLGTLPRAIKEEIAQIKDWDAFDVFNVRARAPRPPARRRTAPPDD